MKMILPLLLLTSCSIKQWYPTIGGGIGGEDGKVGDAWPGASVAVQEFFDDRKDFEYLGQFLFKKLSDG